jgi:alkaline phosphatase D
MRTPLYPLLLLAASLLAAAPAAPPPPLTFRLAFGSCNRQNLPQPLWPRIAARAPSAFAWLGDIVYADHAVFAKVRIPATLPEVAAAYAAQAAHPAYAAFAASGVPIVGMWDDHDLGHNDGGVSVAEAYRHASKALLLDFLGERAGSARREREGGAHTSYFLVPGGGEGAAARVLPADRATLGAPLPLPPRGPHARLILLDVRFSRDDFAERPWAPPGAPGASAQQDMLGPHQWQWLEEQLQQQQQQGSSGSSDGGSPAAFTIITSGLQVLPAGDAPVTEGWVRHPASLARLLALLALHTHGNGRFLFLSGDVHFGELSVLPRAPALPALAPLYELTSSGMTHSWGGLLKGTISWLLMNGALRARVGGGVGGEGVQDCRSNLPWGGSGGSGGSGKSGEPGLCYYSERNWGEVDLEFPDPDAGSGSGGGGGVATLRLYGADSSEAKITATVVSSPGAEEEAAAASAGAAFAAPAAGALPRSVLEACAHPPHPPLPGVSPECLLVLGPLARAAALPNLHTLLLHVAVAAVLLASALAALAMLPLLYCVASGRASACVAARCGCSELTAHALVGAALALYCTGTGGVVWSVLEQLLV